MLDVAYMINNQHVRPALLAVLRECPLKPPYLQRVRHIFKAAELRGDAEIFGRIAHRFETVRGNVKSKAFSFLYDFDRKSYRWTPKKQNPLVGPKATAAFSHATRHYLRQRVWRTLMRLGQAGMAEDYVRLATGVLLPITNDGEPPRFGSGFEYSSDTRRWESVRVEYDRFHKLWAASHILYGRSRRYRFEKSFRALACFKLFEAPAAAPTEREEAFPYLWEQHPRALLHLLDDSRCEAVHQFAAKALRACRDFCRQLDLSAVLMLLRAPYEATLKLGFDLAVMRYDAARPDRELLLALAGCGYQRARRQAHTWIAQHQGELLARRLTSPSTRSYVPVTTSQEGFTCSDE